MQLCDLCLYTGVYMAITAIKNQALPFLKELGFRIAAEFGEFKSTEYMLQRLSVAVQREKSTSVLVAQASDT